MQSQSNIADAQISPLVSTRGHFNLETGQLKNGHIGTDYDASNVPGLQPGTSCPEEAAIYVHGVWTGIGSFLANFENETGIFDRARMSLASNNYSIPVIGFSWDSNTTIITPNNIGWSIAKDIAQDNGPKLAHFIFDYKSNCSTTNIRIIAHSLGARVVLSALQDLTGNQEWNSRNFKIDSVHLTGAAVDDEQVSIVPSDADDPGEKVYGQAIESQVIRFYNFFDNEDNALQRPYPSAEGGEIALGLNGSEEGVSLPKNYQDVSVTEEIPLILDANGDGKCDLTPLNCTIMSIGDNHLGYVGFVSAENGNLIDDGAMNLIVNDWGR
ncbi:MAG TPA: alpha/beta hydrolase [Nitrososphaeraceae archaeon]|nr:alpha/beta hydrolase [Nitrososphaeraceae archaeon]